MLEQTFLQKLDALRPRLLSRARGGSGGSRKSRMLGTSAEFSDFREYAPGDDIHRVDWNAYARFDKLFLKLFMEEQEAYITVLLDGSASMKEKWPAACQIAEAYAYAALGGGDRVRMMVVGEQGISAAAFGSGRREYPRFSDYIAGYAPRGQGDISQAVRRFDYFPKGLTLIVSDFLTEDGGLSLLQSLRFRNQEVCAAQVLSPAELRPALNGAVRLTDEEGATPVELFADGEALRKYEKRLQAFLQTVQGNCHRLGIPYVLFDTGETVEQAFIRLFLEAGILT